MREWINPVLRRINWNKSSPKTEWIYSGNVSSKYLYFFYWSQFIIAPISFVINNPRSFIIGVQMRRPVFCQPRDLSKGNCQTTNGSLFIDLYVAIFGSEKGRYNIDTRFFATWLSYCITRPCEDGYFNLTRPNPS